MRTDDYKTRHAAAVKARYYERKAAGTCVGCDTPLDPAKGDTGTQCRGCADYRLDAAKQRQVAA